MVYSIIVITDSLPIGWELFGFSLILLANCDNFFVNLFYFIYGSIFVKDFFGIFINSVSMACYLLL